MAENLLTVLVLLAVTVGPLHKDFLMFVLLSFPFGWPLFFLAEKIEQWIIDSERHDR